MLGKRSLDGWWMRVHHMCMVLLIKRRGGRTCVVPGACNSSPFVGQSHQWLAIGTNHRLDGGDCPANGKSGTRMFSTDFARVSTRFGRRSIAKCLENTRPTRCSVFPNLRLGRHRKDRMCIFFMHLTNKNEAYGCVFHTHFIVVQVEVHPMGEHATVLFATMPPSRIDLVAETQKWFKLLLQSRPIGSTHVCSLVIVK